MEKRKVGRPRVSINKKKTTSITINLSTAEKEKLEEEAIESGLSLSSLIRFYLKQNKII